MAGPRHTADTVDRYNPFYIEPGALEGAESSDEEQNSGGDASEAETVANGDSFGNMRPTKAAKSRTRGYSLRTQLLNQHLLKTTENYLPGKDDPKPQNGTTAHNPTDSTPHVHISSVEHSYNPDDLDFVRNNEDYTPSKSLRFDTMLTNESIMELSDVVPLEDFNLNSKHSKIRLSGEDYFNNNGRSFKPATPKNNGSFMTRLQLPSAGSRGRSRSHSSSKGGGPSPTSVYSLTPTHSHGYQAPTKSVKKRIRIKEFFSLLFLLLSGGRPQLESVGGRQIPITINISNTDFPITKDKSNQTLLLDERKGKPYVNNLITSSRYTLASFLPRQLIAQFSKLANCYFMLISIFQLIPSWSTTGTSTTIVPLCIFISISILREGYDDIRRHKLDKQENNRITKVLKEAEAPNSLFESDMRFSKSTTSFSKLRQNGQSFDLMSDTEAEDLEHMAEQENSFQDERVLNAMGISTIKTKWKDLKVGDIIKLNCDDWVPADVALLTSTAEMGETFVETMALDGETNLKSKMPNIELNKLANKAKNLFSMSGTILSEDPNQDLYNFEGSLDLPDLSAQEMKKYPLGPDNIIYRGSIIRNTDCCLGVVIFTGEETKIRMNAIKNPRVKAPKLQRKINMVVAFMVFVVLTISCFSLMAERIFYKEYNPLTWYIGGIDVGIAPAIMGFIIMFNTLIPLSLYVTMEIIKAVQMSLLQWDIDMYHLPSDTPAEARTATILEELGQVSYVFSDKTGTLTDNVMIFRKFSVCGVPWIHDIDMLTEKPAEDPNDFSDVFSNDVEKPGLIKTAGRPSMASLAPRQKVHTEDKPVDATKIRSSLEFIKYIQSNPDSTFAKKAKFFLLSIALCHTCLPRKFEKDDLRDSIDSLPPVGESVSADNDDVGDPFSSNNNRGALKKNTEDDIEIEYQASSPDELALVQAACDMGFILYDRKLKTVSLKTYPNGFENDPVFDDYEVLDVIEFSSARKRMSVIVKFPDGKIILFCKGADNIILERLTNAAIVSNKQSEVSRNISQRRRAEAEFILNKKSIELNTATSPRSSLSRLSFNLNRKDSQQYNNINAILENDIHPTASNGNHNVNTASHDEVDHIMLESRKSMDMEARRKYNMAKSQYIPSTNLINDEQFLIERTLQHIDEFSSDGLRTLLYSFRELEVPAYKEWSKRYAEAKTSLVDRNSKIAAVGEEFEISLTLLGCTAIEDKLQDGVPEAIEKLRRAGIKMWMLTGDKRETAINIGYSCKLIKDYSSVIVLSLDKHDNSIDKITSIITATEIEIEEGNVAHCVVVIDGSTLTEIEKDPCVLQLFISLGVKANSVIVCRASPSQKATMVSKVRELDRNKVTLAIGDGANDIAMIQSADVGVGITGKEGLQAARTSDYSIAQFRFLLKLLLVHGRYNYIRTSKFVICTFYKELLFYLSQLVYQRYTMFTGSSLYESWSLSMFNTLFTSLPVLCIGMFDKDLNPATLLAIPELYSKGVNNETFNLVVFIQWVLLAGTQSVSLCFILWHIYGFPALVDNTTYPLGVILFTVFIIVINVKLNIVEMHSISKLSVISLTISFVGWAVWCMLLVGLYKTKINTIFYVQHGLFEEFGTDSTFWATILILTVLGLLIDLIFYIVIHLFKRTDTEIFQVLEKDPQLQKRLELESFNELKQGWTWLHDSQIREDNLQGITHDNVDVTLENENEDDFFKRNLLNFRSFMKKGSTHPSESTQMRKRKGTMVNPNELPPDAPSLVTIRSNDEYVEEMLPSGKIIRIHRASVSNGNSNSVNRSYRKLFKRTHNGDDIIDEDGYDEDVLADRDLDTVTIGPDGINIDEILQNRERLLNEEEEQNQQQQQKQQKHHHLAEREMI